MDPASLSALAQFGAAGLIAWLWLTERRSAVDRERQLTQAHDRLVRSRSELSLLVSVVRDNTRALTSLEAALRDAPARGPGRDRGAGDPPAQPARPVGTAASAAGSRGT